MSAFPTPNITVNPSSWGPPASAIPEQFLDLPYAPFGKSDKLGKCADFTSNASWNQKKEAGLRRRLDESSANQDFQYKIDAAESASFQLVDTSKLKNNAAGGWKKKNFTPRNNRNNQNNRRGNSAAANQDNGTNHRQMPQRNKWAKQRASNMKNGGGRRNDRWNRVDRQASVKVGADWENVEEFDLSQLTKLRANKPAVEDMIWCGFLDTYNDAYDKVTTKSEVPLARMENKEFYYVSTTDDPVIEKFAVENAGNVYATDSIIAHLMASPRSIYPWDIIVQKLPNGTLFFDKRGANEHFDFLTVSETSNEPPKPQSPDDEVISINTPERLSLEATMINQNFSQQILRANQRETFDVPNPFFDEEDNDGMEPAAVGYRYRRFTFNQPETKGAEPPENPIKLIVRCELHGKDKKGHMTAYALNEWDGKANGNIEWRRKIDDQRGAVLATELKNNAGKMSKWSAQSMLAGAEQMKIGYVSRVAANNPHSHVVLATQTFKPEQFAQQINMDKQNMWGIIKMLVELMQRQPDGKYVLLRDPNKAVVRLYSVPMSFNEESEEESESDSDGSGSGSGSDSGSDSD
jgi:translation initiation factor 3 subunit D